MIANNTILLVISDASLRSLDGELIYKFYKNFSSLLARRLRAANEQTTRLAASERMLTLQVKRLTATDSTYKERLRGADLKGADLTQADLKRSDLRGAVLVDSTFKDTIFRESSFRGADLKHCHFTDADLRNCDFTGADLSNCVFRGTNLDESRFTAAQVESMKIVAEIGSDVAQSGD